MLFLRRDGDLVPAPEHSLEHNVAAGVVTQDDLELHLTSLFPFVRLRNYLEVRYLDAVQWPLARSVLALLSGLVYCPTATRRAEELCECLVPADAAALDELHLAAARDGLDARVADGRTFRQLAQELVEYSAATIGSENCKWAENADLAEVRAVVAGA
jgi:gamma-glutamylcysteine synthetase